MCGRFTQLFTWEELYPPLQSHKPFGAQYPALLELAPTQDVGVIAPEDGGWIYKTMGLVPLWAKDLKIGNQAINARLRPLPRSRCFEVPGSRAAASSPQAAFTSGAKFRFLERRSLRRCRSTSQGKTASP